MVVVNHWLLIGLVVMYGMLLFLMLGDLFGGRVVDKDKALIIIKFYKVENQLVL